MREQRRERERERERENLQSIGERSNTPHVTICAERFNVQNLRSCRERERD